MIVKLTSHAIQRAKERCNLSEKSLQRTAQKAFDGGLHHELAQDDVKRWALGKIGSKSDHSIMLLGHMAFLFHFNLLTTVLIVPLHHRRPLRRQRTLKHPDDL